MSLLELLEGVGQVSIAESDLELDWIAAALGGPDQPPETFHNGISPERIGADDAAEVFKLAERAGMSASALRRWTAKTFQGMEPLQVRDALAGIKPGVPLRTVQAQRGHASRALVRMARAKAIPKNLTTEICAAWDYINATLRQSPIDWSVGGPIELNLLESVRKGLEPD